MMEQSIYQSPESVIEGTGLHDGTNDEFYVVSNSKFLILMIATAGFYEFYWFYKHWSQYSRRHNAGMWPIMRAIFPIFFTHSLFSNLDNGVEKQKPNFWWDSTLFASLYVIMAVLSKVAERVAEKFPSENITFLDLAGWLALPICMSILYQAQRVANIACGDSAGQGNNRLTGLNYLWIAVGLGMWVLIGFGIYYANNLVEPV